VTSDLPGFTVSTLIDDAVLASVNAISVDEVAARRAGGHRPYVGFMGGVPATYGWVATRSADIGELALCFDLPPDERYLWDFATVPAWQGRGLYPRLLRAILVAESATMERAWIIHAPENLPSGAGMQKAGLTPVGTLSFGADGRVALTVTGARERARAGARMLGVPLADGSLSPCWRCQTAGSEAAACACCTAIPSGESCACAIQLRPSNPIDPAAVARA
jgi:hypothetical protein